MRNTGFYYYGARYYNPRESLWLSVDPLAAYNPVMNAEHYIDGEHNGGVFNSFNGASYGYCYQNPVFYVDPDGKQVTFESKFNENTIQVLLYNSKMNPVNTYHASPQTTWFAMDLDKRNYDTDNVSITGQFQGYVNNQGYIYNKGEKLLGGDSQKAWYYLAQKNGKYSIGKGDPPSNSYNAMGGLRPVIINGLAYGSKNIYIRKGKLIQQYAPYFEFQNPSDQGKVVVGVHRTGKLLIIVQKDDTEGFTMDEIRDIYTRNGYKNVVSMDGSSSSFLIVNQDKMINNSIMKDISCQTFIQFNAPKK